MEAPTARCRRGTNFSTISKSLSSITTSRQGAIKSCRPAGRMKSDPKVVHGSRPKDGYLRSRLVMVQRIAALFGLSLLLAACSTAPALSGGYRIYATNERSGDLSIIDGGTL